MAVIILLCVDNRIGTIGDGHVGEIRGGVELPSGSVLHTTN